MEYKRSEKLDLPPKQQFWIGLVAVISGNAIMFLCNNDAYHFNWLISIAVVMVIYGTAAVLVALFPVRSTAPLVLLVVLSFVISMTYLTYGKDLLTSLIWRYSFYKTIQTEGIIVEIDYTSSKGGKVEWAIYDYPVDGILYHGAVQNESPGLQPGQPLEVTYAAAWPRWNMIQPINK